MAAVTFTDVSKVYQRGESAAEALGLTPYLKRLPKALSGGQRQRVALGRAIVRVPGFSPLKPGARVVLQPDLTRAVEFSNNGGNET